MSWLRRWLLMTLFIAILASPISGYVRAGISEERWNTLISEVTIYAVAQLPTDAPAGTNPDIMFVGGSIFLSSWRIENTLGLRRAWNSEDPDQIRFVDETGSASLVLRLGEDRGFIDGQEFGPVAKPFVTTYLQMIPLRAICYAFDIPVAYRDGFTFVGTRALELYDASEEQIDELRQFYALSSGTNALQLLKDGKVSYLSSSDTHLGVHDGYLYSLRGAADNLTILRQRIGDPAEEEILCNAAAAFPLQWQMTEYGFIYMVHYGGATMGSEVIYLVKDGKSQAIYNGRIGGFKAIGERVYIVGSFSLDSFGFCNNLRYYNLESGEVTPIFQNNMAYGFSWSGSGSFGSSSWHFLAGNRLLIVRSRPHSSAEVFDNGSENLTIGGTICLLGLAAETERLIAPQIAVDTFEHFSSSYGEGILFREIESGRLGYVSLNDPEAVPVTLSSKAIKQYDLIDSMAYYLTTDGELYRSDIASEQGEELLAAKQVADFLALEAGIVFRRTQRLPGLYCIIDGEEQRLYRGFVQDYGLQEDGRLIVVPALEDAGYELLEVHR